MILLFFFLSRGGTWGHPARKWPRWPGVGGAHPLHPTGRLSLKLRDRMFLFSYGSLRSFWAPTPATLQGPSRQSPGQVHLEKGQTDTGPSATLPKAGHPSFCLCPLSSPGRREAKQVLAPIFITDRTETWRACHPRATCPRMDFRVWDSVLLLPLGWGVRPQFYQGGNMKPSDHPGTC